MTIRFTIDTCCVIDGAQQGIAWAEVNSLVELARQGAIELWLTAAFSGDQRDAKPHHFEANRRWLQDRPIIGQTVNPARLDYSEAFLDYMVLAGTDDDESDQIIRALLPDVPRSKKHAPLVQGMHAKIDDVHHLTSHRMQGNDVFVTRDNDMLKIRAELRDQVGIVVETPAEALMRAQRSLG